MDEIPINQHDLPYPDGANPTLPPTIIRVAGRDLDQVAIWNSKIRKFSLYLRDDVVLTSRGHAHLNDIMVENEIQVLLSFRPVITSSEQEAFAATSLSAGAPGVDWVGGGGRRL